MNAYVKALKKVSGLFSGRLGTDTKDDARGGGLAKALYNKPFWIFMSMGLVAGVGYWIYRSGKTKGSIDAKIPFVDVPESSTITKTFKETALGYINELYRLTEGIDWTGKTWAGKEVLYAKLVKLDKSQLYYVYDLWLQKFWVEREESLYDTIDSDLGGGTNKDAILERLKSFGLY